MQLFNLLRKPIKSADLPFNLTIALSITTTLMDALKLVVFWWFSEKCLHHTKNMFRVLGFLREEYGLIIHKHYDDSTASLIKFAICNRLGKFVSFVGLVKLFCALSIRH